MFIVCLIEKDVFSIFALGGVGLEDTVRGDAVLSAKLLPKLVANYEISEMRKEKESLTLVSALADLKSDDFSGHF